MKCAHDGNTCEYAKTAKSDDDLLMFITIRSESYLPQRFWREGWIANKTLQKLAVQVLESELVLILFWKALSH